MKQKIVLGLLALVLLLCYFVSQAAAQANPKTTKVKAPVAAGVPKTPVTVPQTNATRVLGKLTVTAPHQGTFLIQGTEFVIQWSKQGYVPEICCRIDLLRNGQVVSGLVSRVCVNGYKWKVAADLAPGICYQIQLTTMDNKIKATSAQFPVIGSKANLIPASISIIPNNPKQNGEVTIRARVVNGGWANAGPSTVAILLNHEYYGSPLKKELSVPALGFGDHYDASYKIQHAFAGHYGVEAIAESRQMINEAGENDNHLTSAFNVQALPDLQVCINPYRIVPLDYASPIVVIVKNMGQSEAGPSVLRIWIRKHGASHHNIPALAHNQTFQVTRRETWYFAGEFRYTAEADYNHLIEESDESNNLEEGEIHADIMGTEGNMQCIPKCPWMNIN